MAQTPEQRQAAAEALSNNFQAEMRAANAAKGNPVIPQNPGVTWNNRQEREQAAIQERIANMQAKENEQAFQYAQQQKIDGLEAQRQEMQNKPVLR